MTVLLIWLSLVTAYLLFHPKLVIKFFKKLDQASLDVADFVEASHRNAKLEESRAALKAFVDANRPKAAKVTKQPKASKPEKAYEPPTTYTVQDHLNFIVMKTNYMYTVAWEKKRTAVLARDNHTCQLCGSSAQLNVHHMRGYKDIPNESIDDLVTLCSFCHTQEHARHEPLLTLEDYYEWDHQI